MQRKHLRLRIFLTLALHLLIVVHLLSWYVWEHRLIGAIDMQELFRNLIEKNTITAGALFFLGLLAIGLLWGRIFCGWFCHIGQLYDLSARFFARMGWRLSSFPLRLGPLVAAFVLVYYFLREALVQRAETPLTLSLAATEPWELLPGWVNGTILLALVWIVLPVTMGARAFCRLVCPWGVLMGLTNFLAPFKIRRVGDCTNCGACSPACPMDIDVSRKINTDYRISDINCTGCMQCVTACPTEALAFATRGKEQRAPRKLGLLPAMKAVPLWNELIFWALVIPVALVYDQIYGIGIFLAWCMGLVLARTTLYLVMQQKSRPKLRYLLLPLLLVWLAVGKDALADYHWRHAASSWAERDVEAAQYHLERADALFWYTPTVLMYQLYRIYKSTGQEEKRQHLYERYEKRRS